MGHSYIDFKGKSLHLSDTHIMWIVRGVIFERSKLKPQYKVTENVDQLLEWWSSTDDVFIGPGCYQLNMDKYILCSSDINSLLLLLESLENRIKEFGETVPAEFVNKIANFETDIFYDQYQSQMLKALHKFKELLKGSDAEYLFDMEEEQ